MTAVHYLGSADTRIITVAQWAARGVTVATDTVWDKSNGWSLPASSLSAAQLSVLTGSELFNTNGADGPRPGATAPPVDPGVTSATQQYVLDKIAAKGAADKSTFAAIGAALRPSLMRQRQPAKAFITTFQTGHGATTGGAGVTWNLNDTSDATHGSQCVSGVTAGTGGLGWVQKNGFTAMDLTNADITVMVKVTGLDNLLRLQPVLTDSGFTNYAQGNAYDGTWPAAPARQMREGEWFPLRFNFDALRGFVTATPPSRAAINGIRLVVQDKNNGSPVTVKFGAVYVQQRGTAFPNGICSITFDDSYRSTYLQALPKMAQYGMAGTEYAIQELATTTGLSVADMQTMQDRYGWEIAAHAFKLANHDAGYNNLSAADLAAELANLKSWLADIGANGADHFAYPKGWHSAATDDQIRRFFSTGRLIYDLPSEVQRPAVPLRMRSLEVIPSLSVAAVEGRIDAAKANASWLVLTFHDIVTGTVTGSSYGKANFDALIDYIAASGMAVMPVGDAWRALAA